MNNRTIFSLGLVSLLLAGGLISCGGKSASPDAKVTDKVVLGYYAGSAPVVFNSVSSFKSMLSDVSEGGLGYDLNGDMIGTLANPDLLAYNKAHRIHTYLCVANSWGAGFDTDLGHSALVTNRAKVLDNYVAATVNGGFEGFNLDFEAIDPKDRAAFTSFVHDLAVKLHAKGLKLMLSVPAETTDDPADDWAGAFDYKAIGQDADLLQLMTYDQNGPDWSDPGPVAGADWVEATVAYATTVVDPAKLLIGLPSYGYDWDLTEHEASGNYAGSYVEWISFGNWKTNTDAVLHWDNTTLSPYITYTKDGHEHEAWFENYASIRAKTALVKKYKLAGLSVWALGQEDASFWAAVTEGLK